VLEYQAYVVGALSFWQYLPEAGHCRRSAVTVSFLLSIVGSRNQGGLALPSRILGIEILIIG